jgi:hypothetical protein
MGERMSCRGRVLAAVSMLFAAWCVPAAGQMQMPGAFAVNERGAATYTIPIQVPPGVGGVEPRLALSYNSQRGNGPLGIGWALTGMSAITRCPATMAQDGIRGAVRYDFGDRFCLDGQRLVLESGTYGVKGTWYRTEVESYQKVLQAGPATDQDPVGPSIFVVQTRDGMWMYYGGTDDSRLQAQGKTANAAWMLSSVIDPHGNHMSVTYLKDIANGVAYPTRIDYTSNSSTGLPAAHSVQFDYAARPDFPFSYHAGSMAGRHILRLSKVRTVTEAGNRAVLEYRLGYGASATTGHSRVESVTLCPAAGECLPASIFTWTGATTALTHTNASVLAAINQGETEQIAGDFDGDGKTDLLFRKVQADWEQIPMLFSNGDGTWRMTNRDAPSNLNLVGGLAQLGHSGVATAGDFNGDGKQDIVVQRRTPPPDPASISPPRDVLYTYLSNGDGTWATSSRSLTGWPFPFRETMLIHVGDFNGDGKADLLFRNRAKSDTVHVLFSQGDGTWNDVEVTPPGGTADWINADSFENRNNVTVGDYDGDGKHDLALSLRGFTSVPILFAVGNGNWRLVNSSSTPTWADASISGWHAGDFNGDGKTDLLFPRAGVSGAIAVLYAKGDGTWVPNTVSSPAGSAALLAAGVANVGDYNGDGRHDILITKSGATTTPMLFSMGNGSWVFTNDATPDWSNNSGNRRTVGDFDGDGVADFSFHINGSSTTPILFGPRSNGQLIQEIRRGAGLSERTQIIYSSPAAGVNYTRTRTATPPQLVISPTLPVVGMVLEDDGFGGFRRLRYAYDSAVAELGTGRGFVGFRSMTGWDEFRDTAVVTNYRVDWPFAGQAASVFQYAHWNQRSTAHPEPLLLQSKAYLYVCQNPVTAPATVLPGAAAGPSIAPCVSPPPGSRYQVWPFLTLESQADLNGVPLPGRQTEVRDMDRYGNPGRVIVTTLNPGGGASGHVTQTDTWYSNDETRNVISHPVRKNVTVTTP